MLILTPNRRLAAFSLQQYNQQQLAAQKAVWPTAEIYPIDVWLMQLWQLCLETKPAIYRPILNKNLQQLLIEQIIQQDDSAGIDSLLRVNATAQNVMQAWNFICQWQVSLEKLAKYAPFSADTTAFYTWIKKYLAWLDSNEYYDFHLMLEVLLLEIPNLQQFIPKEICLRGFNELTPQYKKLHAALIANGVVVNSDQLLQNCMDVSRIGVANVEAELELAATWALEQIQNNPQQTVGIVIPELATMRAQVVNVFSHKIPKEWLNISAPLALDNYGLINSALAILQLAQPTITFADISALLRCKYIVGYAMESNQRAQIDRVLRDKLEATTNWDSIVAVLQSFEVGFKTLAQDWQVQFKELYGLHDATHWTSIIQAMLQVWGWPGDGGFTVEETDLLSCWRDLLHAYNNLSILKPQHTFSYAVQLLWHLARETPFLPAETGITRVHVLGILEADGLVFDQTWVCGMSRDSWPMAADPNPYIPIELQRQYDLPRSSPQRELLVAKNLTKNLQQSGKQTVIFSYPLVVDEQRTTVSNLLQHLPLKVLNYPQSVAVSNVHLEVWQDDVAPIVTAMQIRGGTASLQLQAKCPFKANAELRLRAKPLLEPQNFLTPAERGSIVHQVLENFWQQCQTHVRLTSYTNDELIAVLQAIITTVMQKWQQRKLYTLISNYVLLETQRLLTLISRWLAYEAGRLPFVIHSIEQKIAIDVGGLQLNVQVDRIDQLADGSYAIIDYKTGAVSPSDWFSQPIYEPQIPLYAVYLQNNVSACVIATIKPQELKFAGVAKEADTLPGVKRLENWLGLQTDWRRKLEQTAREFIAGQAAVKPYNQKICNICQLQGLCRVYG